MIASHRQEKTKAKSTEGVEGFECCSPFAVRSAAECPAMRRAARLAETRLQNRCVNFLEIMLRRRRGLMASLGQKPRMREIKKAASAESAIHCPEKNIRGLEARFQRLFIPQSDS